MAVPARRTSKMRKNTRRSHDGLTQATTTNCLNCGSVVLSHRACMKCKTYKGVSIYPTKDEAKPVSASKPEVDDKPKQDKADAKEVKPTKKNQA